MQSTYTQCTRYIVHYNKMCEYTGGVCVCERESEQASRIISAYLNTRRTLANVQYVPLKSAGLYLVQELKLSCMHTHIFSLPNIYKDSEHMLHIYFPENISKIVKCFKFQIAIS